MSYFSYKYHEVLDLKESDFQYLYEAMEKAKAQEKLDDIQAASYPHFKSEDQKRIHKNLYDQAMTKHDKEAKIVTTKDLLRNNLLGGHGK